MSHCTIHSIPFQAENASFKNDLVAIQKEGARSLVNLVSEGQIAKFIYNHKD